MGDRCRKEIMDTGRWVMEKGLTWGTSGNISVRSGDSVYITASGTEIGNLKEEDILVTDLEGQVLEGNGKPSKETIMHLMVYRNCPEIKAVLHASPFHTTFAACTGMKLMTNLFIESMYYDENLRRIPYYHAGSRELADAVAEVCAGTHVILMEHHGVLVYDSSLKECRCALEVTENVCRMNLMAASGGISLEEIDERTVTDFLKGGYFKKRRAGSGGEMA